ncbi:hypothetical protein GT725_20115 [Blautia wexlerae]|nr:hypothetical protein [Blautia wexlerae]
MNKEKALKNQGLEFREDIWFSGGIFIFGFFLSDYKKIQKEETGYEIFKIFTGCQHVRDDAFFCTGSKCWYPSVPDC